MTAPPRRRTVVDVRLDLVAPFRQRGDDRVQERGPRPRGEAYPDEMDMRLLDDAAHSEYEVLAVSGMKKDAVERVPYVPRGEVIVGQQGRQESGMPRLLELARPDEAVDVPHVHE